MKIKLTNNIEEANLITHAGNFHADDIFATVLLSKITPNPILCRVNNLNNPNIENAIVYDIGGGKFDHHQLYSEYRENGIIKYSSIGLLWREFGEAYIKTFTNEQVEMIKETIDETLIKQIDAIDNGIFPNIEADYKVKTMSDVISMFNPSWNSKKTRNDAFIEALEFAEKIFDLEIEKILSKTEAYHTVNKKINEMNGNILILEEFMPFKDFIFESSNPNAKNIKFVIFPSVRDGYTIHTVPQSKMIREARLYFPNDWCGLRDTELQKKTGINSAVFVHPDGFIASCLEKEDAILLATKALFYR
ncbi:MAG: MYG1 family protein [Bacilli bacterium]